MVKPVPQTHVEQGLGEHLGAKSTIKPKTLFRAWLGTGSEAAGRDWAQDKRPRRSEEMPLFLHFKKTLCV